MSLQKRPLGQTGLDVSCLGLGTVKFGRNQEVKYPNGFALPSDSEISALLAQAKQLGINLLDTAPAYGSSEQRLGRLLESREDWILCTKVGEQFHNAKSFFDFTGEHVRRSVEQSLRNLATDYLDIVLIHSDGNDLHILESTDCLPTLLELKAEGLIRAIGMSTKTVEGGLKAAELTDAVMVTYNMDKPEEAVIIDRAAELNKGILVKKALNSGHIDKGVGTGGGKGGVEENLRFALSRNGVSSVIIGTINPDHLADNVAAATRAQEQ